MKFLKNKYLIDDILNKDHPSDFEPTKEFSLLILRLPYIKDDNVEVYSYGFLIRNDEVYIFNRKTQDFEKLGSLEKLYDYLDIRIDKILVKLNKFHMQIAKIEDNLYENNISKSFPNEWLKLKKDLVLIERLMAHAMIAFERFIKYYKLQDNFAFMDLNEHINRSFRFARNAIEKLDYLYEFFKAKQDEKMNKIMFILTILSGIFLPLTLVTGFFGMNTGGLPLTHDPYGTIKAIIIAFILDIPIIYIIWKNMKN